VTPKGTAHRRDKRMKAEKDVTGSGRGEAGFGIFLMALGTVFLLTEFDLIQLKSIWRLWPLGMIIPGAGMLFSGKKEWGMGVMLILQGAWFLAIQYGWMGLTWRNSWPLMVITIGIGIVVDALTPHPSFHARVEARFRARDTRRGEDEKEGEAPHV
jgi:hypothetical protein